MSALDAAGMPFFDPEADGALFDEFERRLELTDERRLIRLPLHINDAEFSAALIDEWLKLAAASSV